MSEACTGTDQWHKLSDGTWHHLEPAEDRDALYFDGILYTREGNGDMSKTARSVVYAAINTERAYQDELPPSRTDGSDKTVGDYITMMGAYYDRALQAWASHPGPEQALEVMRKLAAIAVHCMEDHGAPERVRLVLKPRDPVRFKPAGSWWYTDETGSREEGPFSTEAAARLAFHVYCKSLDQRDAEANATETKAEAVTVVNNAAAAVMPDTVLSEEQAEAFVGMLGQPSPLVDLRDGRKLKWLDVSDEEWREYIYPDGTRYRVDAPLMLNVTRRPVGDSHRLVTDGGSAYVAAGWRAIEWKVKEGCDPFSF